MSRKTNNNLLLAVFVIIVAIAALFGEGLPHFKTATHEDKSVSVAGNAEQKKEAVRFVITEKRRKHILYGDETGGGHKMGMGRPGKTKFPAGWDDDKIIDAILQVANDAKLPMRQSGKYWLKADVVEGVAIRAVLDRDKGEVVTGYPIKRGADD